MFVRLLVLMDVDMFNIMKMTNAFLYPIYLIQPNPNLTLSNLM
jgi:hypothetical protein